MFSQGVCAPSLIEKALALLHVAMVRSASEFDSVLTLTGVSAMTAGLSDEASWRVHDRIPQQLLNLFAKESITPTHVIPSFGAPL